MKLSTSNYTVFVVSFRNNVGAYGEAGVELITEAYFDFEKVFPFKTKTVTEPTLLANGTIINTTRDWDVKLDNAGLINDRKTWKDSKLKYQQFRGRLWTHIMSALSAEVTQLVQGVFEEFTTLQLTYDTLGLWRLIKRCILETGRFQAREDSRLVVESGTGNFILVRLHLFIAFLSYHAS